MYSIAGNFIPFSFDLLANISIPFENTFHTTASLVNASFRFGIL